MDLFLKDLVAFVKQYQNTMDMMMYLVLHLAEFVFLCFLALMILMGIALIACITYDKLLEFSQSKVPYKSSYKSLDKYT